MRTATDTQLRIDKRRIRAEQLTAQVMQTLGRSLADDARRGAYYALLELFSTEGIEIITDHDRAQWGLPRGGPDGWTLDEMAALEQHRIDALSRPLTMVLDPTTSVGFTSMKPPPGSRPRDQ